MFEAYAGQTDPQSTRRFLAATGAVATALLLGTLGMSLVPASPVIEPLEEKVDVRFRPPPPPPPPAPTIEAPTPPPPPTAAPPPPQATTKVAPPPVAPAASPAPLVAPKELPTAAAPEASEAQAVAAIAVAVGGVGDGSGRGSPDGVAGGTGTTVGAPVRQGPINLPENAVPPRPHASNRAPDYPAEAKAAGLEETVIIKVVVSAQGKVTAMKLLRGAEPFASAAGRAVKTWTFEPALVEGRPTAVFRIIRIPFRIRS